MAEMIPEHPVYASKAANALHLNLSRLLRRGYRVVQYFGDGLNGQHPPSHDPHKQNTGSLFWIQKSNQSLFIYISHSKKDAIQIDRNQPDELPGAVKKNAEIINVFKLQQALIPRRLFAHKAQLCPFLLFFPECENDQVKFGIKTHGLFLFGKESLQADNLLTLLRTRMGMPASPFVVNHMRRVYSPEIAFILNGTKQARLLDDTQEIALKSEITLPVEARRSGNNNLRVLNGVAGSGKTQVLVQRARLLRQLNPMQKILILSHNPAINQVIESKYQNLGRYDRKITILPFLDWCKAALNIHEKIVHETEISDLIDALVNSQLKKRKISKSLFLQEVNFIKGRFIFCEAEYLKSSHNGQTSSLKPSRRRVIWRTLQTLENQLSTKHSVLWNDIPQRLFKRIEAGKLLEHFDHILVDEAQYFAPLYFDLIRKSLKPHSGQLYLTFDENQGFLNNRFPCHDCALDLRGHSTRLLKSYRMNPLIMRAAHAFHLNSLPEESDDIFANSSVHPDTQNSQDTQKYRAPQLLHFPSAHDEQTRLFKEIHKLLDNKAALNDILILTADAADAKTLASNIKNTLNLAVNFETSPNDGSAALRICPLQSATGIESPFVFITGVEQLFETGTNGAETLSDDERRTLLIENTRKLYMGMTRASQQLTLMLIADVIPESLLSPHIEIPTLPLQSKSKQRAEVLYLHG